MSESDEKKLDAKDAWAAVVNLIELDIKPRDIMTREAFENAITVVITLGGSTNAVLHLLAMAHSADVKLDLDDFTEIGKRVPCVYLSTCLMEVSRSHVFVFKLRWNTLFLH